MNSSWTKEVSATAWCDRVRLQEGAGCSGPSAAVRRCQLPVDPDFKGIDPVTAVDDKLKALGIDGNPRTLSGFTTDLSNIPAFGLCDVFNYLLCSRADYDQRKLKAYKSFEDYRLFSDGLVECLEVKENAAVLFAFSERRSALRNKTKLVWRSQRMTCGSLSTTLMMKSNWHSVNVAFLFG